MEGPRGAISPPSPPNSWLRWAHNPLFHFPLARPVIARVLVCCSLILDPGLILRFVTVFTGSEKAARGKSAVNLVTRALMCLYELTM